MKANLKTLLAKAQTNHYAIPGFNFDNLEMLQAIIAGAENQNAPVIVMATHSAIRYMGINYVKKILQAAVKQAKVPVVAFLDHCSDLEFILSSVDDSFQAIMYDGSQLKLSENIAGVQTAMAVAQKNAIALEAEIGHVGGKEDDLDSKTNHETNLADLTEFLANTNVDALAIAIGNQHGQYHNPPKLNFELLKQVKNRTEIPLVLHGASGISAEQIKTAIKHGICKVNFGTDLKIAYAESLRTSLCQNKAFYDARKFGAAARLAVQKVVEAKILIVGANQKS